MPAPSKTVSRLTAVAQVAGIAASAWFVWSRAVLPSLSHRSPGSLISEVSFYVLVAWMCGGVVTFCLYTVVSLADVPDAIRFSLRSSAPAMWFAPAVILLSVPVPAAFAVSLLLVVNATRLLVAEWFAIESPVHYSVTVYQTDRPLFGGVGRESPFLSATLVSILIGSLMAQTGVVALVWHSPILAAVCLATSAAILTSLSIMAGAYTSERPPDLPSSLLSIVATFLLAAVLSMGGMAARRSGPAASDSSASCNGGRIPSVATRNVAPRDDETEISGGFPGVILLPKIQRQAMLVVPVPALFRVTGTAFSHPVGIPFSGEYWMFRPPRTRPPLRSVVRRGKPSEVSFHTTDGTPLEMEAYQRLDIPVEIRCCSKIQLGITNTNPGSVTLELTLIDTSEPAERRSESLGTVVAGPSVSSFSQILSFPIPRSPVLHKFDELQVLFHQDQQSDESARIAIERFVLVP